MNAASMGQSSLTHSSKTASTGSEILNDWVRDNQEVGQRSLMSGSEEADPKRYLKVLKGFKIGLVSNFGSIRSISAANVTYQTRGKK